MEKTKKLNKKTIIIGSVIAVLLIGGIIIYRRRKKKKQVENKQPETTKEVETTEKPKEPVKETATAKKEAPIVADSEDTLKLVLKNTLGKGSLKTNDKGVKYVELVINDPNKKPYTWKFFGNRTYEARDSNNVITFSGSFSNGGLTQQIKKDTYAFGTSNLVGLTLNSDTLEGLAKKMFTLKD
jgi:hypothetical protein